MGNNQKRQIIFTKGANYKQLFFYYNVYTGDIEITIFNYFDSFFGLTPFILNGYIVSAWAKSFIEVLFMKNNFLDFLKKPITMFVIKTIVFFAIFIVLLYIYGYNGVGSAKFIYNEF